MIILYILLYFTIGFVYCSFVGLFWVIGLMVVCVEIVSLVLISFFLIFVLFLFSWILNGFVIDENLVSSFFLEVSFLKSVVDLLD